MSEKYIQPFTMTEEITNLIIEIAELTGAMTVSGHRPLRHKIGLAKCHNRWLNSCRNRRITYGCTLVAKNRKMQKNRWNKRKTTTTYSYKRKSISQDIDAFSRTGIIQSIRCK